MLLVDMEIPQLFERLESFQWAPTLGGECYAILRVLGWCVLGLLGFNGHPPLGVNATRLHQSIRQTPRAVRFNGHPPLGVNATFPAEPRAKVAAEDGFNGHPPLGVNATKDGLPLRVARNSLVSMGTHPWG